MTLFYLILIIIIIIIIIIIQFYFWIQIMNLSSSCLKNLLRYLSVIQVFFLRNKMLLFVPH